MTNYFLALGCYAVGDHAWSKTFRDWSGRKVRVCRWCDKKETA